MANKFCPNCGTKIHYTIDTPKFCTNCGCEFAKAFLPSSKQQTRGDDNEEDDMIDINDITQSARSISKEIEDDIVVRPGKGPQGIKFSELMKNPDNYNFSRGNVESLDSIEKEHRQFE